MASTTLVTFLFDCPAASRTIELLGSWDNFSRAYHLKRDQRRGLNIWSGCFTFEDIFCDGDLSNLGRKRNGALKMGGTYWYYYKVDDDEEHHNPSEPSTTVCPLLPGQRLNVLEVPTESRGRSDSSSSASKSVFTRNPNDKYLTPVPPKPLPSPRLGDLCIEPYSVSTHSLGGPRSARCPSPMHSLSSGWERHVRSASTSPNLASNAVFSDFRGLKDKFTSSKRSASSGRLPWNIRDVQIGAPTLISTTAEDMNLVPLSSRPEPQTSSSLPLPVAERMKEFSPLGSHPVDPLTDFDFGFSDTTSKAEESQCRRPRSHVPRGRARANSSDTRRTKHYVYPNEPWLSSPVLCQSPEAERVAFKFLPVPQQPQRPTSSHGSDRSLSLHQSPLLNKNKDLPALPRYLVPAPLFACNENGEEETHQPHVTVNTDISSHFSVWSTGSATFSSPASDSDIIHSPTFSSLTSESSEIDTPHRFSNHFLHGEQIYPNKHQDSSLVDTAAEEAVDHRDIPQPSTLTLNSNFDNHPVLHLDVPSFGQSLFQLDIHHSDTGSRRQAACFGLSGFQGYSLPNEENASQCTITKLKTKETPEPEINTTPRTSVSQLSRLMSDFGYLGEAVV
ncbi:uncharacterized protein BDR25DRAFT_328053 [Lindgomyces ingoldianus]|uniref:Uncharacterized protein n=1 Tax=Lindgomyces ingoldianus TaxID=673940 RepID=A0ACB6QHG1_9PLEO|nr:uncharacterized protein BDR25DRAFT_328053 [Lindgomyces ingoldianus]KAF2466322.1 hypothetical protein BDR25DRAFT_328053 [Lindgomyces ingoldianus]